MMFGVMLGRFLIRARALRVVVIAVLGARTLLFAGSASADPAEAKKIFTTRCMACHTFGKGVKVGPDLKGVTERRPRPWLLKFVRSSQAVIASGDTVATELFEQFKQQRMPDWTDLSDAQIGGIMDWLAASGPDQREPDERPAESATIAEIAAGRELFHGGRAMAHGGIGCASCHSIRDASGSHHGGTLSSDLTNIYSQYQDGAMTQFLRHPCFQRFPESTHTAFLAPEESFALKAYLRETALTDQSGKIADSNAAVVAKTIDGAGPAGPSPPGGTAAGAADGATPAVSTPTRRVAWAPRAPSAALPGPRAQRGTALSGELLFLVFPYAALLVLLIGLGVRHAIARRQPDSIRVAAANAWQLFRGTLAWRIALAATAGLHVLGLVLPGAILAWNGVPVRLYLLEGSGFVLGVVALVGLGQIMWRHVGRSIAAAPGRLPEIADYALLSLCCVAIVSGLVSAVMYRWGSSWAIGTLVPYMESLGRGDPAPLLVQQMPFLIRLHVFTLFAALALLPFTSAAMILVAAGDRVLLVAARPITALAGAGRRVLARLSPARWLWPEEDAVDVAAKPETAREPS